MQAAPPLIEHTFDLAGHTPSTPRSLLALLVVAAVAYMASRVPHLHHGPLTAGHPLTPTLLVAGLTGHGLWSRYELYLRVHGTHTGRTVSEYRRRWADWTAYLHGLACKRRRCPRGPGCKGVRWDGATDRQLDRWSRRPCLSGARKGLPPAEATRAAYLTTITTIYSYATAKRIITRDPMLDVQAPQVDDGIPRDYSEAELRRIFTTAKRSDERLYLMCWLGYHGLRCMEIAAARVSHCMLGDQEPGIMVPHGKGGKARYIPLQPPFLPVLAGYLDRRAGGDPLVCGRDRNGEETGRPLAAKTVSKLMYLYIHSLGIGGGAHRLRHSGATRILEAGGGSNIEELREWGGWSDSKTARRYAKRYRWDLSRWVALMMNPETGERPPTPPAAGAAPNAEQILGFLRDLLGLEAGREREALHALFQAATPAPVGGEGVMPATT